MTRLLAALVLCCAATPALAAVPVAPFDVVYTVKAFGIPVGSSRFVLQHVGQDGYRMQSNILPNGMAAMLVGERIDESSEGRLINGQVQPQSYRQERIGGKEPGVRTARFDWNSGQVHTQTPDGQATLKLETGLFDPLSLQLGVMTDLLAGRSINQYQIIDDNSIRRYDVRLDGEETVKTPLGDLATLRIVKAKPGAKRQITFWVAPSLTYLPVQVLQTLSGTEILRLTLERVEGRKLPPAR